LTIVPTTTPRSGSRARAQGTPEFRANPPNFRAEGDYALFAARNERHVDLARWLAYPADPSPACERLRTCLRRLSGADRSGAANHTPGPAATGARAVDRGEDS
jgi:hypothetical protein